MYMKKLISNQFYQVARVALMGLGWLLGQPQGQANPTGGSVAKGTATFNTTGSQFTVNQSTTSALINWQTFNIASGETTVFNQPSAASVTWNYINDPSASSINGNISANGYVVLQNPNGFSIGGDASISAHGLVMTTASTPALDLSSGGTWSFLAPPPTAKIINYGQINITGGGSAYLIASDIENENTGTISAPGGKIGLYAGQNVLVSFAPDGRGLSARVTLPAGSVDNQGQLIADAGSIVAQAKVVNQNGLVQANSVQNINGTIELVASDSLTLGASSVISAAGDATSTPPSPGGFVILKSDNTFADTVGSSVSVAGQSDGLDGFVEIFGSGVTSGTILSTFDSYYALLINPYDITLASGVTDTSTASPTLDLNLLSSYSQIDLHALDNIELGSTWNLASATSPVNFSLTAGNNLIFDDGTALIGGNNWGMNLAAGAQFWTGSLPTSGNGGIYLNGSASLQTKNGAIDLWAANEVLVQNGAIRTTGGGSISVTTEYGDVNSGTDVKGYLFGQKAAPYYKVDVANLGGISTAAGGNVTISAGGNVISYLPIQSDYQNAKFDGGTGAFGSQAGNVTITAGGSVYGHYVLANGVGTVKAGGDIGASPLLDPSIYGFALSLIAGNWNVFAPKGSIYIQDVRNPNGVFGEKAGGGSPASYAGYHYFNYDANASVLFQAGQSVAITGTDAPLDPPSSGGLSTIPLLLPPSLSVTTGSGDFVLDTSATLFPSFPTAAENQAPNQNLNLNIGGNFIGMPNGNPIYLSMSDSAGHRWLNNRFTFGPGDHASLPPNVDNPNPVVINVAGNVQDLNLYTTKATHMTVGGDLNNSGFQGENLHSTDQTYIHVAGNIYNSPIYTFANLNAALISANPLQSAAWDSVFALAVDPSIVAALTGFDARNPGPNGLAYYLKSNGYLLFASDLGSSDRYGANPGFIYDVASKQLGFKGNLSGTLSAAQIQALENGNFTVLVANSRGIPILDANGHLQVTTYHFGGGTAVATLVSESAGSTTTQGLGFLIGGPGLFDISAASLNLGFCPGIISYGFGGPYANLQSVSGTVGNDGASVNVSVSGDLTMVTSAIYSIDGGNVNVSAGGQMNLSQGSFDFGVSDCYGIYTTGHGNVSVTATRDINVGSGCIGSFNGGNVFVESYQGSVNAGNGVNKALFVYGIFLDQNGVPQFGTIGDLSDPLALQADPAPYGSGILSEYPTLKYQTPGGSGQPGNITILTPHGNVVSGRGGISQFALNGSIAGGPVVTVEAGFGNTEKTLLDPSGSGLVGIMVGGVFTPVGNVVLGQGGLVGGTVNITAPNIEGLIVSRQNANINASQSFSGTLLSGGSANFAGGGSVAGTVVGIGGISVAGGATVTATLLSQNVSVGGAGDQSTLGTSAGATASAQAAAQQSSQAADQQATGTGTADEDKMKKVKPQLRRTSRVTVLLSAATPTH